MAERKPVLSVRISQRLLDRLDRLVEESGLTRAEMTERCLAVGMEDQEELIRNLESPLKGAVIAALADERVVSLIMALTGRAVDQNQMKLKDNVRSRRRQSGAQAKPAT